MKTPFSWHFVLRLQNNEFLANEKKSLNGKTSADVLLRVHMDIEGAGEGGGQHPLGGGGSPTNVRTEMLLQDLLNTRCEVLPTAKRKASFFCT